MNRIVLALLLLTTVGVYSQKGSKRQIQVIAKEQIVGKNLLNNTSITGFEYVFPERIDRSFLDVSNGFLTVQLKGLTKNGKYVKSTGDIVQYDLAQQNVLWTKKITFQTGKMAHFGSNIFETVANKNFYVDTKTGKDRWEVKNNIFFVDKSDKIGLGYKSNAAFANVNQLEGIELASGKALWKRKLNNDYGWNDAFYTNDSTIIAVNSGLHSINLNTGKGWDYEAITGKNDYSNTIAANAVGIGLGILTGTAILSTGYDVVRDLVSNTIVDSTSIFLASKEELVMLDKESGEIQWKTLLPKDITSKSSIFIKENVVYMINEGIAFMGNRQINFGKPFVAAYTKDSGKQLFLSFIDAKDEPILSFLIKDDHIILVFKNKIRKYSMNSGLIVAEKDFTDQKFGNLQYFIGEHVFITNEDGTLVNLLDSDPSKMFVYTTEMKSLLINSDLEVVKLYDFEALSISNLQTKDLKFISKNQKTQVVDNSGKLIAEIDALSNAFISDNILYNTLENRFIQIDLSQINLN